ncbi:MAG: permease-like cell division protein FtsX, partial [bacterium]
MKRRHSRIVDRPGRPAGALVYFAGEAITGLRRNGLMSVAAVTTVMVVLLTVGASVVVGTNLTHIAGALEADVQIIAFLRDDLRAQTVTLVRRRAAAIEGVTAVRYVSRADALARLRRSLGGDRALANLDSNPLPDSLEIHLADPQRAAAVAGALRGVAGIDEVTYGAQVVDRLLALTRGVRLLTAVAGTLL